MAYRKLNLDRDRIDRCRELAAKIVSPVQKYIDRHSTTSIERTVLRFFGLEEVHQGVPHVNLIVDRLSKDQLRRGVAWWFGKALVHTGLDAKTLARKLATDEIRLGEIPDVHPDKVRRATEELAANGIRRLEKARRAREKLRDQLGLDYVPGGITTEGFGGTLATQDNFRVMRQALDEASRKAGRYVSLTNYSSGLCMSEIAVIAAFERLDILLNDSMYGILFRDINMKRTFVDQYFSRMICARVGIMINTGEDNYLTTTDAYRNAHHVLTSQFINEKFAQNALLPPDLMGLGHAFELDPAIEDGLLYELAQAQMVREIFPRCPIKYMPPTKHMTGDIMFGNVMDAMFNVCGIVTEQSIQLLGIPTEAMHNPHLQDRYWSLRNAKYIFNNARHIGDEITFSPNGKIARRAHTVLENTYKYLRRIEAMGMMKAISKGVFADIARDEDGGKGQEGVFQKDRRYFNPVLDLLKQK
jgi:beta-lysine 5,6-aminomutase alpha subunit